MKINKRKIWKIIIIVLIAIPVVYFVQLIVFNFIDIALIGLHEDKMTKKKMYIEMFQDNYIDKLHVSNSYNSLLSGGVCYYRYYDDEICVMQISQYDKSGIKDIRMINKSLQNKNTDFSYFTNNIVSRTEPYMRILWYARYKKLPQANFYINADMDKLNRNDKYLYAEFRSQVVELSSIERYAELYIHFSAAVPIEMLVTKKDGKIYVIMKYPATKDHRKAENGVSLMEMVKL